MLRARSFFLALVVAVAATPPVFAQDLSISKRDIATAADFRIRMSAALTLGRSHDPQARPLLEQALSDSNAAVRTAAAAGLGALGDGDAVPALERAKAREVSDSARAQMDTTINNLKRSTTLAGVQLVVQIGTMRNATAVRGPDVADVLRNAVSSRARNMRNIAVAQPSDSAMIARASGAHIPVILLDGNVTKLAQSASGSSVTCQAEVEFVVRKIPDQSLRSTLQGSAAAMGSGTTSVRGMTSLQDQAIGGAVESALRNADQGLLLAAR